MKQKKQASKRLHEHTFNLRRKIASRRKSVADVLLLLLLLGEENLFPEPKT